MAGVSSFDKKVYEAIERTDRLPDDFKSWLPRYLRYQSQLQVTKAQLQGVMGENFKNVGDVGNPAFVSPWRHYQGGATAYGKVRFYKDYLGFVHLDGLAETTGTPAAASSLFNLPAGYRPTQVQMQIQQGSSPGGGTHVTVRVEITATGDVQILNPAITGFTTGSWVSLANIHFRAG